MTFTKVQAASIMLGSLLAFGAAPRAFAWSGDRDLGLAPEVVHALSAMPGFESFKMSPPSPAASLVTAGLFDELLNPSDLNDARTFKQRYYVDSEYADASNPGQAPVVYYICGESECTDHFTRLFPGLVAKELHAHLVALEHRYYGKSLPFEELTTENLRYLSTENALGDLARFQNYATEAFGLHGKWLAVGGSYPGSLAAYYRLKHPDLVVGALASSAPVEARNAFVEYDRHVAEVLGPTCVAAVRKVVDEADASAADPDPEKIREFKQFFGAQAIINTNDFLYLLADIIADAVQYGGHNEKFCQAILAGDPLDGYVNYVMQYYDANQKDAVALSPQAALNPDPAVSGGMRQWYYQSCTEYGYWQDANPELSLSTRSTRINQAYDRDFCQRAFGITELADTAAMNARYYQPLLDPKQASQILYTAGTDDPWTQLTITPARGNDTNPATQAYLIDGTAHCADLHAPAPGDSASLQGARALFLKAAEGWLQ